jgi:hypothetical protein
VGAGAWVGAGVAAGWQAARTIAAMIKIAISEYSFLDIRFLLLTENGLGLSYFKQRESTGKE